MTEQAGLQQNRSNSEWAWKHIIAIIVFSVLGAVTTFLVTHYGEAITKEKKIIETSSPPPINLAALPGGTNELEVQLKSTHNAVKSAFRYNVTIANKGDAAATDFPVVFAIPDGITLLGGDPEIVSDQPDIKNSKPQRDKNYLEYVIKLLNPRESVTWNFFGYSQLASDPTPITVTVHAKDFQQNRVAEAEITGTSPDSLDQLYTKRISEFNGRDIFRLMTFSSLILAGIITYVALGIFMINYILRRFRRYRY